MACVSNLFLAGLLALVAWSAGRAFRRYPAVAHCLWVLVLVKLITPPLLDLPVPIWAVPPVTVSATSAVQPESTACVSPSAQQHASDPVPAAVDNSVDDKSEKTPEFTPEKVQQSKVTPVPASVPSVVNETTTSLPTQGVNFSWSWLLLGVWGLGTVAWWSMVARRLTSFQQLLRLADPPNDRVRRLAEHGAQWLGLGACPEIRCVPAPISPMVWAWCGRPVIVLPQDLIDSLNDTELATLLLHELAHVKRGDHWIRWLEVITLGLQWWNPLAWWAKREVQRAEEACCDAWVVWGLPRARASYAVAMVRAMDYLAATPLRLPAGASGLGTVQLLKRRIEMLNHGATARALPRGTRWLLLLFALAVLPLGTLLAQEDDPPSPPRRPAGGTGGAGQRPRTPPPPPTHGEGGAGGMGMRRSEVPPQQLSDEQKQDLVFEAEIAVKQAELQIRSRRNQIDTVEAEYRLAEMMAAREQKLHEKGTLSKQEFDASAFRVVRVRNQMNQAKIELEQAELQMAMAKRRLDQYRAGRFMTGGMRGLSHDDQPARPRSGGMGGGFGGRRSPEMGDSDEGPGRPGTGFGPTPPPGPGGSSAGGRAGVGGPPPGGPGGPPPGAGGMDGGHGFGGRRGQDIPPMPPSEDDPNTPPSGGGGGAGPGRPPASGGGGMRRGSPPRAEEMEHRIQELERTVKQLTDELQRSREELRKQKGGAK